jgi:hypothetical protein
MRVRDGTSDRVRLEDPLVVRHRPLWCRDDTVDDRAFMQGSPERAGEVLAYTLRLTILVNCKLER